MNGTRHLRGCAEARPTGPLTAAALTLALTVALTAGLAGGPTTATAASHGSRASRAVAAAPAAVRDPLYVRIDRLTPSVMPGGVGPAEPGDTDPSGTVTVTGSVTNRDNSTWSELSAYLLTSYDPMTTGADLAAAATSNPQTELGGRIIEPGFFEYLPDLAPGDSTRFRLSVPRSALVVSGEPGVYWLGVHVLGTVMGQRLEGADGRARTFLPLVPEGTEATPIALGIQLRRHTVRSSDGRLEFLRGWQEALSPGGRLSRLLRFGASSDGFPFTWVVDPAVTESARSVAQENPPLTLEPQPSRVEDPGTPETQTGSDQPADPVDEVPEAGGAGGEEEEAEQSPAARRAERWLERFVLETGERRVLALPYGDLDVASTYGSAHAALLDEALRLGDDVLEELGVPSSPVVAPPSGYLQAEAVAHLDPRVRILLGESALPGAGPVLERTAGTDVLLARSGASVFGARPGTPRAALAVRQRIVAEAALHALSPERRDPFVALLPPGWDPGEGWRRAAFFDALDQPWLDPVGLTGAVSSMSSNGGGGGATVSADLLLYPESETDAQLGPGLVAATAALVDRGVTLDAVLTENDSIGDRLGRQALLGSSVWSRRRPGLAGDRLDGVLDLVQSWFDEITVQVVAFVTLSSGRGEFGVTLVNGLDHPVRVGIDVAVSGGRELEVSTPATADLAPGERRALRISASASDVGIHQVRLQPVSETGTPLGAPAIFSVRTSNVGRIVWVVMAAGGLLLFLAVLFRIARRVRARRGAGSGDDAPPATHRPAEEPAEGSGGHAVEAPTDAERRT